MTEMSSQTETMPPLQSDDFRISIEVDSFLQMENRFTVCVWFMVCQLHSKRNGKKQLIVIRMRPVEVHTK